MEIDIEKERVVFRTWLDTLTADELRGGWREVWLAAKRHAAQVAETIPAVPGTEIAGARPAVESEQNQAVSSQDSTSDQRAIPDNPAPSGASVDSVARDAARFRQAIEIEDNAEALYAAVMNNTPHKDAIRAEFDAAMSPTKAGEGE